MWHVHRDVDLSPQRQAIVIGAPPDVSMIARFRDFPYVDSGPRQADTAHDVKQNRPEISKADSAKQHTHIASAPLLKTVPPPPIPGLALQERSY